MLPVQVNTEFGLKQYNYLSAKRLCSVNKTTFKAQCSNDYDLVGVYLTYMLEDEDMTKKYRLDDDDMVGWRMFKELHELSGILKYFAGRFACYNMVGYSLQGV